MTDRRPPGGIWAPERLRRGSGKGKLGQGLILLVLLVSTATSAQVGTWGIEGVQRGGCRPPLAPCPNRFFGRMRNTIVFEEDGTYRVPRDPFCDYTGAVLAEEYVGTWMREGRKNLLLNEAGTLDYFSACYDLALTIRKYVYKIHLKGPRRFRAKVRLLGVVNRGGLSSTYREKENFSGILLTDATSTMRLNSSRGARSGEGGGAGARMDADE